MLCRTPPFEVTSTGMTDIGCIRARNEDRFAALEALHFYVVADGMGGHNCGDVAATEAVDWACHTFERVLGPDGQERNSLDEVLAVLRFVIKETNKHVFRMAQSDIQYRRMGTTICCGCFYGGMFLYGHAGDSRIYLWRDGELQRLTRDHTLVRCMIDVNDMSEELALKTVNRHVITKAIGIDRYIDPSLDMLEARPGDLFLMCTDGLTNVLTDLEIATFVSALPREQAAEQLVQEVLLRGAPDNVTLLMMQVKEGEDG